MGKKIVKICLTKNFALYREVLNLQIFSNLGVSVSQYIEEYFVKAMILKRQLALRYRHKKFIIVEWHAYG